MGRWQEYKSHRPAKNPLFRLKIYVENLQKDLPLKKGDVRIVVREALRCLNVSCDEIALHFVGEKKIAALHAQFFDDPSITDCISFPLDKDHLGEVFVCPAVAISYAAKKKLDPYEETLLYVVHGILHLIGYDDLEPRAKREMRKMEKKCMDHLKLQGISLGSISS
jgi:probable rRNA maturation factor